MVGVSGGELLLFILSFSINGLLTREITTPVTCDAGAYYHGENAVVTCNFNMDMSSDNRAISVVWYPQNATSDVVEKDVLVCHKKVQKEQKRHCETRNGYKFEDHIDDRLRLQIPFVSEKTAGLYNCFILPSTGIVSHVCTLSIKAGTRPSQEKDGSSKLGLIALLIIPAVGIVLILGVLRYRRKRRHAKRREQHELDLILRQPLIQNAGWSPSVPPSTSMVQVVEQLEEFRLSTEHCQNLMQILGRNMDVQNNQVYIHSLPEIQAEAAFLVIELGSANLKIHQVKLRGHQSGIWSKQYAVPTEIRLGAGAKLFEFIVGCVKDFEKVHGLSGKRFRVGFLFSFPCDHNKDMTKAHLIKWTKEFNCNGVVNKDPGELLQKMLDKKHVPGHLDVKVILNDAMGSLVSGFYDDPNYKMAVTLANGFHACYVQDSGSSEDKQAGMVIIKADLGAVGEDVSSGTSETEGDGENFLTRLSTEYDTALDTFSMNPGERRLEKMVSIMYLGEIVRLVLVKLTEKGLLFQHAKHTHSRLHERDSFSADYVSLIDIDMSQDHFLTKFALEKLQLKDCSDEDCRIVHYVCGVVSERAACLAAAGLAALINRLANPDVVIAIDGPSLNIYHPRFYQLMNAKTQELVEPDLKHFQIVLTQNGGARGAALVAAAVSRSSQTS